MLGLSNDIKVKVNSDKDCLHTISVELPTSKVKEKIDEAFQAVRNQAKLPGFRPGKAPMEIVKENFKGAAYERAQDALLREGVNESLKIKKIHAVQPPVIQSVQFDPEKPFQFEYKVETAPVFKLASYKGMKLEKKAKKISDKDVDEALKNITEMQARLMESKAETVDNHHFAVVDYEGFVDGKPLQGGKADNFLLDMSAPQNIAGLTEGLKGMKTGEEKEITVKFPEDSPSKDLSGKAAIFKVKVKAIKEKQVPELNEEFAKDMGVESLAVLKTRVRENLERREKEQAQSELEKQVVDTLLKDNTFATPPSLVEKQTESVMRRRMERMLQQGMPQNDMQKMIDSLKGESTVQAEKDIRLAYILNSIAEAEGIKATSDEISSKINSILERSDPKERAKTEQTIRTQYLDQIESDVREVKVFAWLIEHAKVKEIAGGAS